MPSKPTFVLVPGNFLPSAYYADTAKLLESHGFQTCLTTIPSTGSKLPLTSNEPDVLAIRQVLEELSNSGKDIIVVAHSYGSIPACEAAEGFERQDRLKLGKSGGVIRLVFVAAWLLQEGENPPTLIERYKMEAPWARFEVRHSLYFDSLLHFLGSSRLKSPNLDRVLIYSPTIPFLLFSAIPPKTSRPTGLLILLTPTLPLSQLR